MSRPLRLRFRAALHAVGIAALAILYGSAYGTVGFYIALIIDGLDVGEHWMVIWLLVWVAFGSVVLTVWTIKWTGIGTGWFQRETTRANGTPPART